MQMGKTGRKRLHLQTVLSEAAVAVDESEPVHGQQNGADMRSACMARQLVSKQLDQGMASHDARI